MVTPLQLYFSFKSAFTNAQVAHLPRSRCENGWLRHRQQVWRAVTNFFYFGPLSFELFFHLFFLCVVGAFLVTNTSNEDTDCFLV